MDILKIQEIRALRQDYLFDISEAYGFSKEKIEKITLKSKNNHTLKNTFKIEAYLDTESSEQFLIDLQKVPNLIYAYQSNTSPINPPYDIAPQTTNFENNQGYIESNPGLNVRYAWDNGINGSGINIRAVEYGINTNHEELHQTNASLASNTTINSGATTAFTEHGTMVAGVVFADRGTYGVSGLAHGANEYILYPEWTEEYGYNRVLATSNAIANSNAGDIIIYEMQTSGQNGNFVPAEYEQVIWDLTKAATDAGIIVVAAAGNGNENLDDTFYDSYNSRGDSGAIIVGAGTADINHSPLSFSTYGSRVNIQAWGNSVFTIGQSGNGYIVFGNDFNQTYNPYFSGTSSATALVGGFAAVLQSYYLAQTGGYLTSQELRTLIINTGIPQFTGNNIGPLPNMQAAMLEIDNTLSVDSENVSSFIMYPNPSKEILNINLNQFNNSATISIHNLIGKQVLSIELIQRNISIPIANLSKGLYLVTIKTENSKTTKKLIIN
ncbi:MULTISPECIES: S8/S53 family peptidase [Winogradskyella]|uniref:S8/S53 family peptidase n=1 Tax=Winogradskyella TaxID=286104 RepID=UPI0015C79B66|nr:MULTISPECIES: S8/S53 family peptidase [Winogradskyella]QXP79211.1 S8 family peptidase [Winogradskyella sp. HaHa_3_26]